MGAHTTSDDPTRYRVAEELEAWKPKDPIERVKAYLFKNELADQEFFDAIEAEADELGARPAQALPGACPTPSRSPSSTTSTPSRTR